MKEMYDLKSKVTTDRSKTMSKGDKIPKEVDASMEQPLHTSHDTDSAVSGHIAEGSSKMMKNTGLPHKQSGAKMPHEHFQDKMNDALC